MIQYKNINSLGNVKKNFQVAMILLLSTTVCYFLFTFQFFNFLALHIFFVLFLFLRNSDDILLPDVLKSVSSGSHVIFGVLLGLGLGIALGWWLGNLAQMIFSMMFFFAFPPGIFPLLFFIMIFGKILGVAFAYYLGIFFSKSILQVLIK
jgi:hypothetical protein